EGRAVLRPRLGGGEDRGGRLGGREREPARKMAGGLSDHREQRRLVGEGLAKLLPSPSLRDTGRDTYCIRHADVVGIGSSRTEAVAPFPLRIAPQGPDHEAVAADGPCRHAAMEDRCQRRLLKLGNEEVVGGFEREWAGALGRLLVPMVGRAVNEAV